MISTERTPLTDTRHGCEQQAVRAPGQHASIRPHTYAARDERAEYVEWTTRGRRGCRRNDVPCVLFRSEIATAVKHVAADVSPAAPTSVVARAPKTYRTAFM